MELTPEAKARKLIKDARYREKHREELRVKERQGYKERWCKRAKTYQRKYHRKLKVQIINHYSNGECKCARCGINDVDILCIDHIDGNGNAHRREIGVLSGYRFYRWLINEHYPSGFQVLCYNCNMKKRIMEDEF